MKPSFTGELTWLGVHPAPLVEQLLASLDNKPNAVFVAQRSLCTSLPCREHSSHVHGSLLPLAADAGMALLCQPLC
jgi:hypothetical protein